MCLIASPDEADGSLSIDQDVRDYATVLDADAQGAGAQGAGAGAAEFLVFDLA